MSYLPATHPEGVFALAYRGLRLFFAGFFKVFFLMLIAMTLASLPEIMALMSSNTGTITSNDMQAAVNDSGRWMALVSIAIYVFVTANYNVVDGIENSDPQSLISCLLVPIKMIFCILGARILTSLIIIVPIVALLMLFGGATPTTFGMLIAGSVGAYFGVLFVFTTPILLTEDETIISAIRKSASLVFGNWWRTFIVILLPIIYSLIIFIAVAFILKIIFHPQASTPPAGIAWSDLSIFIPILALFMGWQISTVFVLLHDLEFRHAPPPA